ncbi:hypothetical protein EDB87DRAFT_1574745 [Lactarius vividus]|nr:hypothetical protein EDB87DRAFT_1574745 [Lactarius vividus]
MPPCLEAGTPAGHSLALFSEGHPAWNEVDRALALTADPGAAGDVHRFRLSMRRKQDLFARMRDLDIAWNDWLADAEGIDTRLRASNITSRIYPFLPQPLLRGLDVYHVTEANSNDRRFRAHMDHLEGLAPLPVPARLPVPVPSRDPWAERPSLHDEDIPRVDVPDLTSCAGSTRPGVTSQCITRDSADLALLERYTRPDQSPTTDSIPSGSNASRQPLAVERNSLERG